MHRPRDLAELGVALAALAACTFVFRHAQWANPTTVSLAFLVLVLLVATRFALWIAVVTAIVAMLGFNFYFLEPVGTLTIADPRNWVALVAFLTAAVVASQLSAAAKARTRDAIESRNEITRMFDLSRDVLLTGETGGSLDALARHIARRFDLRRIAICLSGEQGWDIHQGGEGDIVVDPPQLDVTLARAGRALEFDARERTYGGHVRLADARLGDSVSLVPLRLGVHPVGLLAAPADALEPGTLDAIAGLAAIAVERVQFLSERKEAELLRQRADFTAALLASLSHDLRTPLTALQVAVTNLEGDTLSADQRLQQTRLARTEVERLNRLFRDILDMARVDSASIQPERDWVTAADVVDAALANLRPALADRVVHVEADETLAAHVDPRLTSAAFSHLVENAAQYSPTDRPIDLRGWTDTEGLHLTVRDHGGLDVNERDHLFERFYRGRAAREHSVGTGMGLAITRGLLTAEQGRVWGENVDDGGARFSIVVPAQVRRIQAEV